MCQKQTLVHVGERLAARVLHHIATGDLIDAPRLRERRGIASVQRLGRSFHRALETVN
jgi:hypothetical protein